MARERMTYLNALHLVTTAGGVTIELEQGEFVLEAGVRVVGQIEGEGSIGAAVPCDLHEVQFTRTTLGLRRSGAGKSSVPVEAVASVMGRHMFIGGQVKHGPGGETRLSFGDAEITFRAEGVFEFHLDRTSGCA